MTIAEIIQPSLRPPAASNMLAMPGFTRDDQGRPRIDLNPESLYAFGHLVKFCRTGTVLYDSTQIGIEGAVQ